MPSVSELKSNALQSATFDTILQICLRLVSFFLNAFIVRCVTPSVFAVMTVRLHLLYSTGLLLSREAFRRAALGCKSFKNLQLVVNLIWMGTAVSFPISFLGWILWRTVMESPPSSIIQDYHYAVCLVVLTVVIEVATEAPYIMAELHLWVKVKVVIEGLMQLSKVLFLSAGIYVASSRAVLIYGLSHVFGAVIFCGLYYGLFAWKLRTKESARKLLIGSFWNLFPTFPGFGIPKVDPELRKVSVSFLKQGWIKEALTEGEFYLMTFLPLVTLEQQGIYQVVNNLGSLAARLVFRSVEAAAYKFFAQTLVRGSPVARQDKSKMREVSEFFSTLVKNLVIVSLFIVCFGWGYSHIFLHLYGGSSLSSLGRDLLRFQSFYVVFMALNGVSEAFTFAAMSDDQLSRHNFWLIGFSIVYVTTTIASISAFGVFGFVVGNCVNMLLRITRSLYFINELYEGSEFQPTKAFRVSLRMTGSFAAAFAVTSLSEVALYPSSSVLHVSVGIFTIFVLVFQLRREMEDIVVNSFVIADRLYCKVFQKTNKRKFHFYILDLLYRHLYS